jgi:hypothetical protein
MRASALILCGLAQRALFAASLAALACCCFAVLAPGPARADIFGGISLVSVGSVDGGPAEQVEYAHDATISANGRYVAFDGSIGGVTGVWRRDLTTDAIEQVAGGGSSHPSLSADGQYVSFTTDEGARLPELSHGTADAAPSPEPQNVYVRDMANAPAVDAGEEAARAPGARAFEVVSAQSGSEQPLRYTETRGEVDAGSSAVGRSAISADGREVVFITGTISNLVPYPALEEEERGRGETPVPHTPRGEVAVRYLDSGTTELVSRCRSACGQGAATGAAEPVTTAVQEGQAYGGGFEGASISADGNAVAWDGYNVGQQAPLLSAESLPADYSEPLWRQLPASANETRRVSGGSVPEEPACVASGETSVPSKSDNPADPCQGPFEIEANAEGHNKGFLGGSGVPGSSASATPQLSADGQRVAFVSEAVTLAEGLDFDRLGAGNHRDLFVSDMARGLTRAQALEQITEEGVEVAAEDGAVADFAISPDGTQVAFSTIRTTFPLGEPSLVSAAPPQPGINEMYDADLGNGTITLVTHGYEGGVSTQPHRSRPLEEDPYEAGIGEQLGALSPEFDEGGQTLVFTSTADNLVYGDGNTPAGTEPVLTAADGADVFDVQRIAFHPQPAPQQISPPPPFTTSPAWTIGAEASSRRDGTVVVSVRVPGAGRLAVSAHGQVLVTKTVGRGRHARRSKPKLATRGVAFAKSVAVAPEGELMTVVLRLGRSYAGLAERAGGFSATVDLSFAASGEPTLDETLPVIFAKPRHATRKAKRAARRASHRRTSVRGKR